MKLPRVYYEAVATLTGCIIGAGVLGIPFVVVRSGFWTGMLVIVGLGLVSLLVHLLAGEVCLRTKSCHQLSGYAEKYLGVKGKFLMAASMVIGVYGALVAYTIGVGRSLFSIFGGSEVVWMVLFYVVMSFLLFGGLKVLQKSELGMEAVKLFIFLLILVVLFASPFFSVDRFVGFSFNHLMVPFGVVLFAYIGTAAIPEVRAELSKCKLFTKRVIIWGSLIPMFVYVLFTFGVVGVSGGLTTEVATIGLSRFVGSFGFVLLHLFAILAMATSFAALGYALKDTYHIDFRLPKWEAWALTVSIPAVLLMVGVESFVRVLEVAGVFAGGIAGITIVWMHSRALRRSERKPEFRIKFYKPVYFLLVVVFVVGMLWELFQVLF